MNVKDRVAQKILEISPLAICDDCLADALKLSVRQHANHKTRELQNEPGYYRTKDTCSSCGRQKKVISRVETSNSRLNNGISEPNTGKNTPEQPTERNASQGHRTHVRRILFLIIFIVLMVYALVKIIP